MESLTKWDERFLALAEHVSGWSKDRNTKVGCVLANGKHVVAVGYNGFPVGVDDDVDARHERPAKYIYTEHAERNAVYNAFIVGAALKPESAYCTLFPCADCARALIQVGIRRIVAPMPADKTQWRPTWAESLEMLLEAGVIVLTA